MYSNVIIKNKSPDKNILVKDYTSHTLELSTVSAPRSSHDVDRAKSLPRNRATIGHKKYNLSVSEQVKLGSKDSQFGISGYEVKLWHHDVNKPLNYGIHKEIKPRHYLDQFMRSKAYVPAPTAYNVAKDLNNK